MLGRTSGKRKRKKHRSQTRKFEVVGSFRRIDGEHARARSNALLDAFFAMKEVRFQKMGIANVFAEAGVKRFFRAIFAEALKEPKPSFVLQRARGRRQDTRRHRLEPLRRSPDLRIRGDRPTTTSPMPARASSCSSTISRKPARTGSPSMISASATSPTSGCGATSKSGSSTCWCRSPRRADCWPRRCGRLTRLKAFIKNNRFVWKLAKAFRKKAAAQAARSPTTANSECVDSLARGRKSLSLFATPYSLFAASCRPLPDSGGGGSWPAGETNVTPVIAVGLEAVGRFGDGGVGRSRAR